MTRIYIGLLLLVGTLAIPLLNGCREPEPATEKPKVTTLPDRPTPAATGPAAVGQRAPDFSVADVNGVTRSLGDYGGKILVLDFWATYCKACVKKLKEYENVYAASREKGLEFLALSMDPNDAVIRGWRERNEGQIPLARMDQKTQEAYFGKMQVIPIPQTRIIDRRGVVRYSFGPEASDEEVQTAIQTLLDEKR